MSKPSKGRMVVVSHRVPGDRPAAGGLVFALDAMLQREGGVWIGSAPHPSEIASPEFIPAAAEGYEKWTFQYTQAEHEAFYLRYANSVLWPLFHWRSDLMVYDEDAFKGYMAVNERLSQMIAARLHPDDTIWIHDYHFLPLAQMLRAAGVRNRIGFFLHIPFPNTPDLAALPQGDLLAGWLGGFDLVGLQTERDVVACLEFMRQANDTGMMPDGSMRVGTRWLSILSFPIGIDVATFEFKPGHSENTKDGVSTEHPLVIGVDRLDYTKGLPQRFRGFESALMSAQRGKLQPTLLQIAPTSREDVGAYQIIRAELDSLAGSINGAFSTLDWTPIRYLRRSFAQEELRQMYVDSAVAMVTPLADGMNLVAKEYIAAQDPSNPGVLILSKFAGASEQLETAIQVNPYDITSVGKALLHALNMPVEERIQRHSPLLKNIKKQDITWWTEKFLKHLKSNTKATPIINK